ncbi:hypothetical protein ACSFA0_25200 [Variovorax sp. LT1P1]|uniref:hypothetical protein n=1 Tax=Variovorax sp. LT1P1 TaxID=3443730 RepID=UPI003F456998
MPSTLPSTFDTHVAWRFDAIIPGTFRRNKAAFAHHEYPIVGPLPSAGRKTLPKEKASSTGPFVYFVLDDQERVRYVGKSLESNVLHRWMRPGVGGPAKTYWTHSTRSGGCVFAIAAALRSGESRHFTLRYSPVTDVPPTLGGGLLSSLPGDTAAAADRIEHALILALRPDWNKP